MPKPIPAPDPPPPLRQPEWPAPPYRFVPGLHPHPTQDPDGHDAPVPEDPDLRFDVACDWFDLRYWWEAHECWESLWQPATKATPDADLYQGLILCGAALLQHHVGHLDGARRLAVRAERRLGKVVEARGPVVRHLDLRELVRRLHAALEGGPLPTLPDQRTETDEGAP